jgi:hypothetical protein
MRHSSDQLTNGIAHKLSKVLLPFGTVWVALGPAVDKVLSR